MINAVLDSSGSSTIDIVANDGQNGIVAHQLLIEVNSVNDIPVVDAGANMMVDEGEEVFLNGYGFDVEGEVNFSWYSGEEIIFDDPTDSQSSFTAPEVYIDSEYLFTLTVTDSNNVSVSDSVLISVNNLEEVDIVDLNTGWNLMSFDIVLNETQPDIIFDEQISNGNLVFVTGFNDYGSSFFNPFGSPSLNTLVSLETGKGYWVKTNEVYPLSQNGFPIVPDYSIELIEGWSILAYWFQQNILPEEAFTELIADSNLVYVTGFGENGATFFNPIGDPELNTLTALENQHGYAIKVNEEVGDFIYPLPSGFMAKQLSMKVNQDIVKTNNFMFLNGQAIFKDLFYSIGEKVNILTHSGLLVGEMEILQDGKLRTGAVYGDDPTTDVLDGAIMEEKLVFMYGDIISDNIHATFSGGMELKEINIVFRNIPEEFALIQNYPNPFNPITTIQYHIPSDGFVSIKIFDMLGREIMVLEDAHILAGYRSVKWDGKDRNGISVSGGIYFYQLKTASFEQTKKMILLR